MIDGKTKVYGLIGNPVEHTMSPLIHNTIAEQLGEPMVYVPFPVERGKAGEAVAGAKALSIQGLNVTVPFKSEVIPYLNGLDGIARRIGAVNTLVAEGDGYRGYNTDMPGLLRAMHSDGFGVENRDVMILGAGGAARAVAYLCAENGAKQVFLLNRTLGKAQEIAVEINAFCEKELIRPMLLSEWEKIPGDGFLAVQATSVGLYPNVNDTVIEDRGFYKKLEAGYDLIYRPWKTKFMKLVEQEDGSAFNGLKMLLYQAVIAYELWNRTQVPESLSEAVYLRMRKEWESNEA